MADYPPRIPVDAFTDPRAPKGKRKKKRVSAQRSPSDGGRSNTTYVKRIGVKELLIQTAAGDSTSFADDHSELRSGSTRRVHFVPRDPALPAPRGGPGETVKIKWKLGNPSRVASARLELFTRQSPVALWTVDLVWDGGQLVPGPVGAPVAAAHAAEGELDWDGCLGAIPPGMTEPCVSVGQSPYKLKMTVQATHGRPQLPEAWTYFDVLAHDVRLEWGATATAKDIIPDVRADVDPAWHAKVLLLEKGILDDLHANPITADQSVFLGSNLFTTDLTAEGGTDASYRLYRKKWGDGPLIPLLAHLRLKGSDDQPVDAPWALDGARVLWDWEDDPANKVTDWLHAERAETQDFVEKALDYCVDLHADMRFAPPGSNNCHVDHGGKRGKSLVNHGGARGHNAPTIFPEQAAPTYALGTAAVVPREFPFPVTPYLPQRPWAARSQPRTRGVLAGRTGVLFQPSRMAGDRYKVSAYLDHENFPYADDAPTLRGSVPAELRSATGVFEVRRKIQVRILRKTGAAPNIAGNAVNDIYEAAGVAVDVVSNGLLVVNDWETAANNQLGLLRARNAVNATDNWFFNRRDLYAAGADCVFGDQKLTPDGVVFQQRGALNPAMPANWDAFYNSGAAGPGSNPSMAASAFLPLVQRDYIDTKFPTDPNPANDIEGLFVFLFRYRCSHWPDQLEGAASSGTATETRSVVNVSYDLGTPSRQLRQFGPGPAVKGFDQVVAHEIAHALCLPHSPPEAGNQPPVHLRHVPPSPAPAWETDDACLMNYHPGSVGFCGVCNLRLRGWAARGPLDAANTEALIELYNAPAMNRRDLRMRCEVSLPATPPKTKRLMPQSDTAYNVPVREERVFRNDDPDLDENPPLVLLTGTVVNGPALADPGCTAVARPILLSCVVEEMPVGSRFAWKVERSADDHASLRGGPLPSLTDHGDGTATLLSNATGTFSVKCSVNVDGSVRFDDAAPCVCVSFVMVKVTRIKSDHHFTAGCVHVQDLPVGGDVRLGSDHNGGTPMRVRTKVLLVGGGPAGKRGLDKVYAGWVNNMTAEDTEVEYTDALNVVQHRARTIMLHRRADNSWVPLAPAMDAAHPLVDKHTAGPIASWEARKAVLSAANPSPQAALDGVPGNDLAVGREVWIQAEDGPAQGWDEHPPTQPGYTLLGFNLDLSFCAYLCFWTADAKLLAGVLEEVPWEMHAAAKRASHAGHYKLDGKPRVTMSPKTKHQDLVAAVATGVEICPPGTVQVSSQPRNVDGTPTGTDWATGLP